MCGPGACLICFLIRLPQADPAVLRSIRNMATTTQQANTASQVVRRNPGQFPLANVLVMGTLFVVSLYFLLPCYWLLISATKTSTDLFSTFSLWLAPNFNLFNNLQNVFTYDSGLYGVWLWNSFFYASTSALLGTLFSSLAGYALAKYIFRGRNLVFSIILGAVLVPAPALVLPLYLLMSGVHLTDTVWAIILPSIVNPFGVYLARIYASSSVPDV